jgi:DNA polymerase-3 subunit delta'
MSWQGIHGHDEVAEQFRRVLARERLATSYLFVGPPGIGKHSFALRLAQSLLCERPAALLDPCGRCDSCRQVLARSHPDLDLIAKPKDRSVIPVDAFIGSDDGRDEGLCRRLARRPFLAQRKVAIIDDADSLNQEGANSLLKTLEEPPAHSLIILVGTSAEKQLPTIRSRCQIMRFRPLSPEIVCQLILEQGLTADPRAATQLAEFSGGSLTQAREFSDPELWPFRQRLLAGLAALPRNSSALAQAVNEFVEAAGKEASLRRERTRCLVRFGIDFYRQRIRAYCSANDNADDALRSAVDAASKASPVDPDAWTVAIEAGLETLERIDRNAHLPTLIEWWIDRWGQITAGRVTVPD